MLVLANAATTNTRRDKGWLACCPADWARATGANAMLAAIAVAAITGMATTRLITI
jgi:hypothetical protein